MGEADPRRLDRRLDRRMDRRQVLRAALLAGAGLALPAGCGIPTGGAPVVYGTGPVYDPAGGGTVPAPEPGNATSPTNLVELFLSAVSGRLDDPDAISGARQRAAAFLTDDAKVRWKAGNDVVVYRVGPLSQSTGGGNTVVSGTLQAVGQLTDRGAVDPYQGDTRRTGVQFTVIGTADGYRITELPPLLASNLPLAVDALSPTEFFTPQLVYFWDATKSWLVPELRYVPRTVKADGQLTQIVTWLLKGPNSADLTSQVTTNIFPSGTSLGQGVTTQEGRVVVPFSAALQALQGPDLERVLSQLEWSMHPLHRLTDAPVEVQIGGQKQQVNGGTDRYRMVNLADEGAGGRTDSPQLCYVVDKAVVSSSGPLPLPLTSPDLNKDVAMAAVSRNGKAAAVVTATGGRLLLGRSDRGTVSVQPVEGLPGKVSGRPMWLPSNQRLLVAAGDVLVGVTDAGQVSAPLTGSGVAAFAVSPEAFRVAYIQNGRLLVAALDQRDADQPTLSSNPRVLDPGLANPSAVAWSRLDRLVVAGQDGGEWKLTEISVDGAIREAWNAASFVKKIVWVVAYARLPTQSSNPGQVLVQTDDGHAYHVYGSSSQPDPLTAPAPTSSASPTGAAQPVPPTAPFFPD